ncbi:MAG: type I methionyl aminopeptidase [Candidatus Neomarinimicrobiota bacterium]|jgi:methionyl aminopeptidase|nr:type I methionyl aminopeptidase [Candidatus Neomarinimicrobiota bacterium]MDD3966685.1 type I methionyl aminopeptidase [Candidatus Neomarinimicrobiota bacterium]MDX9781078.1 type I methionyl aminopeptidase [bacterium]
MIYYKTAEQIEQMRLAGSIVCRTLNMLEAWIKPGVSSAKLDRLAETFIRDNGATPSFKGYGGFPATLCISRNEEVVHGIPSEKVFLQDGDIVSLDCGVYLNGYHGDHARSYAVGNVSPDKQKLMDVTKCCLELGIEQARAGNHLSDIGHAIQSYAESQGFSVVRELVGHGIGRRLHEDPQVPNYGKKGQGIILKEGLVIAIEPMVNMGKAGVLTLADGWTVVTRDRKPSAHFEHTVVVGSEGPEILTNK